MALLDKLNELINNAIVKNLYTNEATYLNSLTSRGLKFPGKDVHPHDSLANKIIPTEPGMHGPPPMVRQEMYINSTVPPSISPDQLRSVINDQDLSVPDSTRKLGEMSREQIYQNIGLIQQVAQIPPPSLDFNSSLENPSSIPSTPFNNLPAGVDKTGYAENQYSKLGPLGLYKFPAKTLKAVLGNCS